MPYSPSLRTGAIGSAASALARSSIVIYSFSANRPRRHPRFSMQKISGSSRLAWNFYVGLLLASTFAPAHRPVMLTGVRRNGEIDIRQQQDLDAPVPCIFRPYPPVLPSHIQVAAQLGEKLGALAMAPLPAGHWRLFRSLHVYTEARTTGDILDRLHQYSRCIDGLILPDAGRTRQQFRSRTELFIGPRHQGHPVLCTIPYS